MEELYVKKRSAWRKWLTVNHAQSSGVWLVFYKKHTNMPTLSYDDAVEEALCFGWIDSLIKKRDDDSFVRKLTPRKSDSLWSDANKARVAKLTQDGLMASPGKKKVAEAKRLGVWEKSSRPDIELEMPIEFSKALAKNKTAKEFFDLLAPSYQRQFIGWIASAKRSQTKQRRVEESINLLESGQRLGMK